jgi:hypothetical protein
VRLKSNVKEFLASFSSCHLSNAVDKQHTGKLHYFKKTEDFFWRKSKVSATPANAQNSSLASQEQSHPQLHNNDATSTCTNTTHHTSESLHNQSDNNNHNDDDREGNLELHERDSPEHNPTTEMPLDAAPTTTIEHRKSQSPLARAPVLIRDLLEAKHLPEEEDESGLQS